MSHLTVKSFLQQNQHVLSTREYRDERERKAKEAERAEAGRQKHEVEQKHILLAKETSLKTRSLTEVRRRPQRKTPVTLEGEKGLTI